MQLHRPVLLCALLHLGCTAEDRPIALVFDPITYSPESCEAPDCRAIPLAEARSTLRWSRGLRALVLGGHSPSPDEPLGRTRAELAELVRLAQPAELLVLDTCWGAEIRTLVAVLTDERGPRVVIGPAQRVARFRSFAADTPLTLELMSLMLGDGPPTPWRLTRVRRDAAPALVAHLERAEAAWSSGALPIIELYWRTPPMLRQHLDHPSIEGPVLTALDATPQRP